jgi:peptide/nickel transport system permease protein
MQNPSVLSAPRASRALWLPRRNKQLRGHGLALVCALFLLLVVLGAIFAPLSPYDPLRPNIPDRLQGPSLAHPFGTDEFGRDLLTRVLWGARPMLLVGIASVVLATALGSLIGVLAAYQGGWLDNALMRLMDVLLSFPSVLLAILIVAGLGAGLLNLIVAITCSLIPLFARLARSLALGLIHRDFVLAARCLGLRPRRVVWQHIVPNMLPPLLVQATATLAFAFSVAASLNFLGLGVQPPTPDLGLLVSEGQRLVFDAPHVSFFGGLVIALIILSVNFVGDSLQELLDPVLKRR